MQAPMTRRRAVLAALAATAALAAPAHADPHPILCAKINSYQLRYYIGLPQTCVPYVAVPGNVHP
jgi:hypothetical protein